MKVLIIEDEIKVVSFLQKGLEENDFEVTVVRDGIMGKQAALEDKFDFIILDLNLPYLNGYEVCKAIRVVNQSVPILMLTALGATEDKINGFESGADDYLVKPFEFRELLARIRAILNRIGKRGLTKSILKVANLEINPESKTVKRGNQKIDLTAKEFALLEYFVLNKGRVLSRTDIAEKIWEVNFDTGTNVIDVYVNFLRKKVDRDFEPKLIHTRVGMGYILEESE